MIKAISHEAPEEHGLYPIRTVSQMTGVNPITLRAWERRHGLIKPLRTDKGQRLYTAQDIADIQRVVELLEHGMSIGQVPALLERSRGAAPALRASSAPLVPPTELPVWQDAYRSALTRLDEQGLDALEADALAFATPDQLLARQLLPMLDGMEAARQNDAAVDA
ncbi:MAG TPA: MerR family transcriptional regulator, partial [Chromatiales bacterium]|nr:MerR family transcriptional regulator [Chromatiales bacterium]